MLTAFLAGSGGKVVIPDAVNVMEAESPDEVCFVDAAGKTLVVFQRSDVCLFTEDGAQLEAMVASADTTPPE